VIAKLAEIDINKAKEVLITVAETGEMPKFDGVSIEALEQWCREAIAANPKALADFKGGKDSAINGFKGPVMKAAKGKADPKLVDETLRRLLAQM
jgi:aspartyl-tRNA(Asn)/glutamyl-tRNA(Gln) amidotransferase subunit B